MFSFLLTFFLKNKLLTFLKIKTYFRDLFYDFTKQKNKLTPSPGNQDCKDKRLSKFRTVVVEVSAFVGNTVYRPILIFFYQICVLDTHIS